MIGPEIRRMSEAFMPAQAYVQDADHLARLRRWVRRYGVNLIALEGRWIIY